MLTDVLLASFLGASMAPASGEGALRMGGREAHPAPKVAFVDPGLRDAAYPAQKVKAVQLTGGGRAVQEPTLPAAIAEKRMQVGIARDIAAEKLSTSGPEALDFVPAPRGGATARLAVTSPQAASLRIGLRARALPAGAELRFLGSGAQQRIVGPVVVDAVFAGMRDQGVYWTPVTEGETQTVEIWVPSPGDAAGVELRPERLSHLAVAPSQAFKSSGPGAAGACHQDVACVAPHDPALARVARSVAKLVYTENGSSYLCSGTLVNDGGAASQSPYMYTAAHCIGSRAAASSLNTFWFYEASACGDGKPGAYQQLSGGAALLYANTATDAALVRLADPAPAYAWFSGWDATPLPLGSPVIGVHHPLGDLKKVAAGVFLQPGPGTAYALTAWTAGTTEPGSSGSGVFTLAGGEYLLRGGLRGGSASCASSGRIDDPGNRDYYSRIELEAGNLKAWLAADPAPVEDHTGMWSSPDEPGWGLTIIQDAAHHVFATWFTYDAGGNPTWLVIPEGKWATAGTLEGALYRVTGTGFDQPYDMSRFRMRPVGVGRIDFGDASSATLAFTVDGRAWTRQVRRMAL